MGCFNVIVFTCPKCGGRVEAQSKAGDCSMREFTPESAPPAEAVDVIGEDVACEQCGEGFTVRGQVITILRLEA